MLGHLVSNGYAASPDAATRPASGHAVAQERTAARHSGWLSRLLAHLLHRR